MSVEDGIICDVRIAMGGMAATPKRASAAEAALNGQPWSQESFEAAATALSQDFSPLTDWRASSDYRMLTAQNLLRRFFLEHDAQTDTPVQLACA
jgi:xanthine dehydrogenase small subunit